MKKKKQKKTVVAYPIYPMKMKETSGEKVVVVLEILCICVFRTLQHHRDLETKISDKLLWQNYNCN